LHLEFCWAHHCRHHLLKLLCLSLNETDFARRNSQLFRTVSLPPPFPIHQMLVCFAMQPTLYLVVSSSICFPLTTLRICGQFMQAMVSILQIYIAHMSHWWTHSSIWGMQAVCSCQTLYSQWQQALSLKLSLTPLQTSIL
jgi:hypothetical protein